MATTPKAKACAAYCKAMAAGKGVEVATIAATATGTKVGHAVLDLAWYACADNNTASATPALNVAPADHAAAALALRGGTGWDGAYVGTRLSWGRITVALGYYNPAAPASAEAQVRNRFGAHTGLASQGQRIGRGGRYLARQPLYYTGNHKVHGVEDARPRTLDPAKVAANADAYKPKVVPAAKRAAAKAAKAATPKVVDPAPVQVDADPAQ